MKNAHLTTLHKAKRALTGNSSSHVMRPITVVGIEMHNELSTGTHQSKKSFSRFFLKIILSALMGISGLVAVMLLLPSVYFSFFPVQTVVHAVSVPVKQSAVRQLPVKNPDLPLGDWLVIPRIGVRTPLRPTADANEALSEGVWQDPSFGKPGDFSQPIIVAGHRYGWQWWWKSEYWRYHSFYLLPDLEPGDRIEIISDQRKWVYEIYSSTQGDEITDYSADLIVYTCKYLTSSVRHFRYARYVEPG